MIDRAVRGMPGPPPAPTPGVKWIGRAIPPAVRASGVLFRVEDMDIHAPELPQPVSARLWHVRVIFDDGTEDKIINSVYPQNAWRDYDEACQHYGHRGRVIVEARDLSPWYEVDPSDICA